MSYTRNLSPKEYKKLLEESYREIDELIQQTDKLRAETDKIWRENQVTFFQLNEEFQKRLNQKPEETSVPSPKIK